MADASKIAGMSDFQRVCKRATDEIINQSRFQARYALDYGEYRDRFTDAELRAKVHVFCPPLLEYIVFALALAPPDEALKTSEFKVVIHPDTRLLDRKNYTMEDGHESMSQIDNFVNLNRELKEPIDEFVLPEESERRQGYLATRFDQIWIDQRVTAMTQNKYPQMPMDAFQFFNTLQGAGQIACIIIMAAPEICDLLMSSTPLVGPDGPIQLQQSQIYELEELSGAQNSSPTQWGIKRFCRISTRSRHSD